MGVEKPGMTAPFIRARHLGANSLGSAGKSKALPKSYGVHQRLAPRISAACARNDHAVCYSLRCTCDCGHRGVNQK